MKHTKINAMIMAAAMTILSGAATVYAETPGDVVTSEMITLKDSDAFSDWENEDYTSINLDDTSATIYGDGATADGGTITIAEEGTYVVTGILSDGQILVAADENAKVRIILDGAQITCSDGPAINIEEADKVTISLSDGKENVLSDTSTRSDEDMDAVIYSKADLVLNGGGSLIINAAFKDAIHSKDDLRILEGIYTVDAVDDGFVGKDAVEIAGGTFTVDCEGDAFKSTNEEDEDSGFIYVSDGIFDITSGDEGFQSAQGIQIEGGTFTINATGKGISAGTQLVINDGVIDVQQSYEGLEGPIVVINGGDLNLTASDDGINAAGGALENGDSTATGQEGQMPDFSGEMPDAAEQMSEGDMQSPPEMPTGEEGTSGATQQMPQGDFKRGGGGGGMMSTSSGYLYINGGTIYVNANGDGIDSNTDIFQTGGDIIVEGPTNDGNGALDYDGTYDFTGGTLLALGSSGMMQSISESSEESACDLTIIFTEQQDAGTQATIKAADDSVIADYTTTKVASSAVIASTDLKDGETYTILLNGEETGTVTLSGTITSVDETGAEATGGGMMGGGHMNRDEMHQNGERPEFGERPGKADEQFDSDGEMSSEEDLTQSDDTTDDEIMSLGDEAPQGA